MSDISSISGATNQLSSISKEVADLSKQIREAQEAKDAEKDVFVFEKRSSDIVNDSLQFSRDIGVLVKDNSRLNVITNLQAEDQADYFKFRVVRGGEIQLNSISQLDFQAETPDDAPTGITVNGGAVYKFAEDGTVAARLGAEDEDEGDTFTYTLVTDAGKPVANTNFEIVDDEVRVKKGNRLKTDSATVHSLKVRVTDSGGNTHTESISIRVESNQLDVEPPDDAADDKPVNFRIQVYTRNGSLIADNEGPRDDLKEAFAALDAGTYDAKAGEYVVKVSRASHDVGKDEIQYAVQITQGDYKNDFDTIDQPFQPGALPVLPGLSAGTTELLDGLNSALSFFGNLPPIGQTGSEKLLGAMTDVLI